MNNILTGGAALLALGAAAHSQAADSSNRQRPNVIIILADDLGYGDLACYGASNVATPNVDRFASRGIRFTNAHASAATSTPSRYGLLTGEYAWRRPGTDVAPGDAGMIIRPEQYTIADMFRHEGYRTAAFGKWHLGIGDSTGRQDWNAPLPCGLGDIGFEESYIMAATADRVPCVFIHNDRIANYDPEEPIYVSYHRNFEGEPTGRDNPELLFNMKPSQGHDQSIVNGISRIGYMKGGGKALWKDENIADSITDHAVEYIKANAGNPFFVYFCTNDIHVPRFPHDRFRGKNKMGVRGDAIVQFDWSVGRILDTLDSLGIADNTLIILSSDNGPVVDDGYQDRAEELLNGHSPTGHLRGGKYSAFQGGTRVPLIVSWPDSIKTRGDNATLMSQIDLFASLGKLIGATLPKGSAPDSRQRLDNLLGISLESRPWVTGLSHSHIIVLRTPEWTYIPPSDAPSIVPWGTGIETGANPKPQLYKASDIHERTNIAAHHPDIVSRLDSLLQTIRSRH